MSAPFIPVVSDRVFKEVVLPLLSMDNATVLAVTQPDDEFNYYAELVDVKKKANVEVESLKNDGQSAIDTLKNINNRLDDALTANDTKQAQLDERFKQELEALNKLNNDPRSLLNQDPIAAFVESDLKRQDSEHLKHSLQVIALLEGYEWDAKLWLWVSDDSTKPSLTADKMSDHAMNIFNKEERRRRHPVIVPQSFGYIRDTRSFAEQMNIARKYKEEAENDPKGTAMKNGHSMCTEGYSYDKTLQKYTADGKPSLTPDELTVHIAALNAARVKNQTNNNA